MGHIVLLVNSSKYNGVAHRFARKMAFTSRYSSTPAQARAVFLFGKVRILQNRSYASPYCKRNIEMTPSSK
jgi:hypothetical protein